MNTPLTSSSTTTPAGRDRAFQALRLVLMLVAMAFLGAGCGDDDPVQPGTSFEVRGLVLRLGAVDTVVVDTTGVRGSLHMQENTSVENIDLLFIKKDGTREVPGSEYSLAWTIADPSILDIQAGSAWRFNVQGKNAGATTVVFTLLKGTSVVYTSPTINVSVSAMASGLKAGDTLVYDFYERDSENVRTDAGRQEKTWYVLRSNLSFQGKTDVVEILEIATAVSGGAVISRDTLYVQMAADGSFYQFDMLRSLLNRVEGGEVLSDKLPQKWIRVSNTSQSGASSWAAMDVDSVEANNITLPDVPLALNMAFRLDATHKGRVGTTVGAGSYPDAVHTDHSLRLNARLAAFPVPVLYDSIMVRFDVSSRDGLVRQVVDSKTLVASAAGQSQNLMVNGYEMELKSYKRAQ